MSEPVPEKGGAIPLEAVLITGELARRGSRPPDYAAENLALVDLADELATRPAAALQKITDSVLKLLQAGSAGISVLEGDLFRWHATSGAFSPFVNTTVGRHRSPCGATLDRDCPQLFREPVRHFTDFAGVTPVPLEVIVVPIHAANGPAGAVWAVSHTTARQFDAEDARLLSDLARYAGAAVQSAGARADVEQARQMLHAADARLRLMIESATDYAIFSMDVDGRVATWNGGAERIFGWEEDEILGQDVAVLFTPEDRLAAVPQAEQAKALESGRAEDERWHIRKDGSRFFASGVMTPLRDGALVGFTKVARDVTPRKRHEDRQKFLSRLTEQTRGSADADGVLWAVLTALGEQFEAFRCNYTEIDAAAGTGTVARDHCDGVPSIAGVYRLDSFGERIIAELKAGRTVDVGDVRDDPRIRGHEAAYAALGCRAYVAVPLVKGGRLAATLNVMGDRPRKWDAGDVELIEVVAERLWGSVETAKALSHLAASEGRLQLAIEIAEMGMFETDLETGTMVLNEPGRKIYGWPGTVGSLTALENSLHPDDRAAVLDRVRATFDADGPRMFEAEHRIVRPDGEVRWVRVRGRAIFTNTGGAPSAVRRLGTFLDVTERKRTEVELRDADRKKDDFLAQLAHELRNPLAPIRNGLQVIRLSDDRFVRQRSQEMMDRQLGHMVRLIDDLLDVSRITRNKMELRRERVALADVLACAVETAKPALDAAGHELAVELPPEPIHLDADLTRLAQVFGNLLCNSAKYTPRGGRVRLAARRKGTEIEVAVTDSGIGIPAESLDRIFDMFAQIDRSIERTTGGLGIGLALVRGLVEMHGGTVEASSPGPGEGSTFTVRLPVPDAAADPRPLPAGVPRSPVFGKRILVVDDNRDGAKSMADMLALLGSEVATAHDGIEAVAAADAFRPEAILMDLGMPRLNGLDATRRIRDKPWGKGMAIIALTGWGQESDRRATREAGCDRHLVKPVSLADLQKLLGELTGGPID